MCVTKTPSRTVYNLTRNVRARVLNVIRFAIEKNTVLQLVVRGQSERLIHNSESRAMSP